MHIIQSFRNHEVLFTLAGFYWCDSTAPLSLWSSAIGFSRCSWFDKNVSRQVVVHNTLMRSMRSVRRVVDTRTTAECSTGDEWFNRLGSPPPLLRPLCPSPPSPDPPLPPQPRRVRWVLPLLCCRSDHSRVCLCVLFRPEHTIRTECAISDAFVRDCVFAYCPSVAQYGHSLSAEQFSDYAKKQSRMNASEIAHFVRIV